MTGTKHKDPRNPYEPKWSEGLEGPKEPNEPKGPKEPKGTQRDPKVRVRLPKPRNAAKIMFCRREKFVY